MIYEGFRLEHDYRQRVSYATLVDANGKFASPTVELECDGEDHADGIRTMVEEWHAEHGGAVQLGQVA